MKQSNKERLAHYVETTLGLKVNTRAMFDVQIKRLHEYKVRWVPGSAMRSVADE